MRIMVLEFTDCDSAIFDEIMEVVNRHPDIEYLRVKDEQVLSLTGLEIYPGRRKIYRDRREINLTAKEYDLLCLLVANKGQVLTYDQIYRIVTIKFTGSVYLKLFMAYYVGSIFMYHFKRANYCYETYSFGLLVYWHYNTYNG